MESIYEAVVDVDAPNHAHGIALQLVGTGNRVLELGAAGGHVTRALKARDNIVTAVEVEARFEQSLRDVAAEVLITDLDWLDLGQKLSDRKFDVILAGDVLEHCREPELVVFQFHELLENHGRVIVSLPNIAHGDVRLSLLAGVFEYSETGLLDRTHVRFFTRETIKTFFESSGFSIEKIFGSTTPLGTTEVGVPDAGIPIEAINFVREQRDAAVYQYIIELRQDPLWTNLKMPAFDRPPDSTTLQKLLVENGLMRSSIEHLRKHSSALRSDARNEERELQTQQIMSALKAELEVQAVQLAVQAEQLRAHVVQFENQMEMNTQLSAKVRQTRDQIIGKFAEVAELQHRLEIARSNNAKLRTEIDDLHKSRAWRIGRMILLPVRLLRRALRLLR